MCVSSSTIIQRHMLHYLKYQSGPTLKIARKEKNLDDIFSVICVLAALLLFLQIWHLVDITTFNLFSYFQECFNAYFRLG